MLQPNGTFAAYSPEPYLSHITTGQAIKEMLAYAIYFGGVNLQIGQIDPDIYVPFYPVRSTRIADCIKMALRPHPDCTCEIDYTTTPPTFNIRQRANLAPVTLPYKSVAVNVNSRQTHLSSKPRPRPDLIPSRVGIYIKSNETINGNDAVSVGSDIYPPTLPSGLRSLDASVDMSGPKLAKTTATLTTSAFDPTNLNWWAQKVPALKSQSSGGQIPNAGSPGALALVDAAINSGPPFIPRESRSPMTAAIPSTPPAIPTSCSPARPRTGCRWSAAPVPYSGSRPMSWPISRITKSRPLAHPPSPTPLASTCTRAA